MSEQILTFEEALTRADEKKHLMIGNGFSVSLFPDIFNYKRLSEKITDDRVKRLFQTLNTYDFEYVMWRITEALRVIENYEDADDIKSLLQDDIDNLKNTLISTIVECHPEAPNAISEKQYEKCRDFLHHFKDGKKYTFNYDLLLYWVYMHFLETKEISCNDGFLTDADDRNMVTWEIGREQEQNLYYLHGAMHIFSDKSKVEKYTWINTGETLSNQVNQSIDEGNYPVFISEGTTNHKKMRINNNAYLARSFSSLKSIGNSLFIHGHSLRDEDDHVFNYVNRKKKKIFISIYGNASADYNETIISKINSWRSQYDKNEYFVYQSETANVWGEYDD